MLLGSVISINGLSSPFENGHLRPAFGEVPRTLSGARYDDQRSAEAARATLAGPKNFQPLRIPAKFSLPISVNVSTTQTEQFRPVLFRATVPAGSTYIFVWNFGDNTTSDQAAPSHTYLLAASYIVVLHVFAANGSEGTATTTIQVAMQIYVVGSPVPLNGSVGSPVSFTVDTYAGVPPYTYFWTFGDLESGHQANTTHVYSRPGSYYATLYANDSAGAQAVFSVFVVIPYPAPQTGTSGTTSSVNDYELGAAVGAAVILVGVAAVFLRRRPPPPEV